MEIQWTDFSIAVPAAQAELAEAIALEHAPGGIYSEDFRDFEQNLGHLAAEGIVEPALLQKSKEQVRIHLYIPASRPAAEETAALQTALLEAGISFEATSDTLRQQDWENSWKQYYHAMAVGSRLALHPAWEPPVAGRVNLSMDPGMAFGTGTHETTKLCLEAVDRLVTGGERVLDIGSGSGILGIACCLLGASECLGIDIDPLAVQVANENSARNGVGRCFTAVEGDLSAKAQGKYQLVLANIVAGAILQLLPAVPPLLAEEGAFVASGIIDTRGDEVAAAVEAAGLVVAERHEEKGWVCLVCRKK